ncbi:MAG: NosD domain-containing protein [Pseudomonadota bacterium]|nr:NosD domain-containing protein [Pseudomonadota bacterium]
MRVTKYNGPGGAVIEENTFPEETHSFLDIENCQQKDYEPIVFRRNKGIYGIYLTNVSGALISENEIGGWKRLLAYEKDGVKIYSGSFNIIQDNKIQVPESIKPYQHYYAGIALGLEGHDNEDGSSKATDNEILNNSITNYNIGIGMGSAARNKISGNTVKDNLASIHLGPHNRNDRGTIYGTAQPRENEIWDNILVPYDYGWYQGVNVRISVPSEDCVNIWNTDKTAGGNVAGGPFMGGNYWSDYERRYDEKDINGDGIWDEPYVIDNRNQDNLPLVMPIGLTLSAGNLNPTKVFEFYGLESEEDYTKGKENVIVAHVTLAANRKAFWEVTGLTFNTSGTGNEKEDILRARLYKGSVGGTLLGEAQFDQDNGGLAFSFDPAIQIPSDESVSLILTYDFKPERAFPCNDYRAVISTSGIEATPLYAEGGKLFPENGTVQGIIRVKPGVLVKEEGDSQYGEAKDPAINKPLTTPLKSKITWQHPATVDHAAYKIVSNPDFGAFLQQGKDERKLLSEIPLNEEGFAEEIMTLGTKKGLKNPYLVEIEPISKGAQCEAGPPPPFYTAWGMGVELEAASQYDNPADSKTFGTFLSTIQVDNKFTLTVQDMAPAPPDCGIKEVLFTLGDKTVVGTVLTENQKYEAEFDMADLERPQKLIVTVKMEDSKGVKTEQEEEYDVKALKFPPWIDAVTKISESVTKEFSDEDGGTYIVTFNYPTNFIWSDYVPESVGLLGGLKNDLDIEFTASAKYRVNETSAFEATLTGKPTILGKEIDMEGSLSGEFDANFAFQRGTGNISSSVSFDLPSKGYSRTFLVYGIPVTAAVDLSGNVEIFVNGSAVLNRQLEFEEIIIAPGTTVTGNVTISLAAVFGLAKIAATGSPTVTMEIELRYTTASGTETTWRGEVVVPITVVGSIFWGVGSATLCETTLGPWQFGSGRAPQAYRPLSVTYPLSPRLMSASDLAVDGTGRRMSVWIGDTRPEEASPNPDVFFRYDSGSGWGDPAPIIGAASPNAEWETDPKVVFMKNGAALACWTANDGDQSLAEGPNDQSNPKLDAILSHQDIACSYWNGTTWGAPVKISVEDPGNPKADGTAALSYFAENKALAVWVHNADANKRAMERTAWQLRYSLFDPTSGEGAAAFTGAAIVPGTDTGKADQMPAVAADGAGKAMLVWARDDDGNFHTELGAVTKGTNVNAENDDSHIMYSLWSGSGWSTPAALATGGKATRLSPALAPAPGGAILAVWAEKDPTREAGKTHLIRYSVYSNGAWSTPGVVAESGKFMEEPKAAIDGNRKATVIWRGYAAGGKGALFSSTGTMPSPTWSEPQQITHDDTIQWQPTITVDKDNKVVTAWSGYDAKTGAAQSGIGLTGGINIVAPNPGTASLTDTYSATAMDADNDQVYESLDLSVGVNVASTGNYKVQADLYAADKFIFQAVTTQSVTTTGATTFVLTFPGGVISNRGLDGPYSLKNVVVLDLKDSPVQTAYAAAPTFNTQAYQASRFIPGPLALDKATYQGTATRATISVKDAAANKNTNAKDQLLVRASTTKNPQGFVVTLEETGADTGIFTGTVGFSVKTNDPTNKNILVADHDTLTVVYTDANGHRWTENALWKQTSAGLGDINSDGAIDLADAILALRLMAGLTTDAEINPLGTIDDKGKITIKEVILILQKAAGIR